jgi:hypothetical protein
MNEVLSYDTGFDYIARVNARMLSHYQESGDLVVTPEQYRAFHNEVAGDRTIDGMCAGDWLFAQPVSNINGTSGTYLVVFPELSRHP